MRGVDKIKNPEPPAEAQGVFARSKATTTPKPPRQRRRRLRAKSRKEDRMTVPIRKRAAIYPARFGEVKWQAREDSAEAVKREEVTKSPASTQPLENEPHKHETNDPHETAKPSSRIQPQDSSPVSVTPAATVRNRPGEVLSMAWLTTDFAEAAITTRIAERFKRCGIRLPLVTVATALAGLLGQGHCICQFKSRYCPASSSTPARSFSRSSLYSSRALT